MTKFTAVPISLALTYLLMDDEFPDSPVDLDLTDLTAWWGNGDMVSLEGDGVAVLYLHETVEAAEVDALELEQEGRGASRQEFLESAQRLQGRVRPGSAEDLELEGIIRILDGRDTFVIPDQGAAVPGAV